MREGEEFWVCRRGKWIKLQVIYILDGKKKDYIIVPLKNKVALCKILNQ